jgi:hypothetical protein
MGDRVWKLQKTIDPDTIHCSNDQGPKIFPYYTSKPTIFPKYQCQERVAIRNKCGRMWGGGSQLTGGDIPF